MPTKVKPTKIKINYTILVKVEVHECRPSTFFDIVGKLKELPNVIEVKDMKARVN